jgi:hypothetical protein
LRRFPFPGRRFGELNEIRDTVIASSARAQECGHDGAATAGLGYESWIDRQIGEAEKRGKFDDLRTAGKPLPDLGRSDENWWIKGKLREEGLSYTPPSLALKKSVADALAAALEADSDDQARAIIEVINEKMREANRKGIKGPPVVFRPFQVEGVVRARRGRGSL